MRALGVLSDKEIIQFCLLDMNKYKTYINLFIPSIHDGGNIFNQEVAIKYIASFMKVKTNAHVMEILMDYLLPHIGEDNFIDKAYYIGYMVNELVKVYKKDKSPTDRDSFKFKRVELTGSLIYDLFKEYYTIQQKHIYQKIDKEYYYKQGVYQSNFTSLIENNYQEYFKERILENGFKKAFKGSWGAEEHTKRPEVIQDLNRLSYNSFISHLRKVNLPLDSSAKIIGPRLLHSSQWGIIDPVDTPDGGNVGLHKHMSLGAHITSGYSSKNIIELLRYVVFIELLSECSCDYISKATKVFVNGAWIGVVTEPVEVLDLLKNYRRLGLIPVYTSIGWSIVEDIIYIYTDSGRLCRPVFYVNNKIPSFKKEKLYNKLITKNFNYSDLLVGFNKFKDDENIQDNKDVFLKLNNVFYGINDLYNKSQIASTSKIDKDPENLENQDVMLKKLLEQSGIIDYLDTAESETMLIATYEENINKFTTHLEIHPSLLLGVMGNQIVFPENNQLPRDLFSCGQSKQGVSLYNSNYQNRIDKMGVVLNNGQIPIVKSRYLKHMYNEEHPYGVNAIVAIGCYGGYNVEDSILFNEGSIKRGMFNTTYLNMYETREESSKVAGSVIDSKFTNIENENVIGKKPGYDYSVLDKHGLIQENTELDDKKVIIGKVNTNLNNPENYIDSSITPKKGQLGFVDKSFITEGEEGFRLAKVRIREERIPAMGDKFCSRCGQKGTVGLIIPEKNMPFTDEGIRPDLIINPHALPSRMTIGQLVETLMGKTCAIYGGFGDCTAFTNKGSKYETFGKMLRNVGYNSTGNEVLYSGETGEQLNMELFIGPCYYMRLKHMVKDKINYRAQGPRTVLTRQTVQGRANDGGLRIGEMERDCIIAHGATNFLQESMLKRGDDYYMAICNNTGTIAIYNESRNIFISPFADGPIKFNTNIDGEQNIEVVTKYGRTFSIVRVPYAFKLLMQELQVMNIQMRIITEDNIDQLTSMNYKNTIDIMKDKLLNETQKMEFNKTHNIENESNTLEDKKTYTNGEKEGEKDGEEKDAEEGEKEGEKEGEDGEKEGEDGEKEGEDGEKEGKEGEDDEDDEEGLSEITKESIRKAEEEYEKYKDLEDSDSDDEEEEKPPLTIGDQINDALSNFVEVINKNNTSSQDNKDTENNNTTTSNIKDENDSNSKNSILDVETEVVENNDERNNNTDINMDFNSNTSDSNIRKTVKIDNQ
jgi:DNA-directed RNA polymerase beta subunit